MARLLLVPNDDSQRYSIAFEGRVYPNKPSPRSEKEAPMALMDESEARKGWVLVNVHSLGRLGFSRSEIHAAVKKDRLDKEISARIALIAAFNPVDKGLNTKGFKELLQEGIARHPDPSLRKVLKEHLKSFEEFEKTTLSNESVGSDEARQKLLIESVSGKISRLNSDLANSD